MDIPVQGPREIGECIYCGSRAGPLGNEHAVPYGVNGPWKLLKATCKECAEVTHRLERDTMRPLRPEIRNLLAMQSQRLDRRSSSLPLRVKRGGVKEFISIPRPHIPTYLPVPVYESPGVLTRPKPATQLFANVKLIRVAGPTLKDARKRYPTATFESAHKPFSPEHFARTLAKIAFCAGVCALGLGAFTQTPIRRVILGSEPCIGHWVGSWYGDPMTDAEGGLHRLKVWYDPDRSDVYVFVRLFAQVFAREYQVILGQIDAAYFNSDEWTSRAMPSR